MIDLHGGLVLLLLARAAAFEAPASLFVCGLGYTGERIACEFKERFPECEVSGSTRSAERAAELRARRPWLNTSAVFDLDDEYRGLDAAGREALARATHVVQTVAPIADGDADPLAFADVDGGDGSEGALEALQAVSWACHCEMQT